MSMSTYNLLKKHFIPELSMSSIFILQARILKLSHVTEVSYDCCPNTCCCFTRNYTGLNSCPFSKHAWYNSEGHSYKKYKYLPIEPHINHSRSHAGQIPDIQSTVRVQPCVSNSALF